MNAAAKHISQYNVFDGRLKEMHLSKQSCFHLFLLVAVLFSALAVIYTTNLHRMMCSQLETLQQQAHQLELQWGQLTLEQASLATPARVEQLASEKLQMVIPLNKQAFLLRVP